MNPVRQLALLILILGSCAPKAVLVEEAGRPTARSASKTEPEADTDLANLPNFKPNDGLLDPPGLTRMPTKGDMEPTVEKTNTTVIANPPEGNKPTSE